MNVRYVLAFCGLILALVSSLAGEGGPLDSLSSRQSAPADVDPEPRRALVASSPPPPSVIIEDYEPPEAEVPTFVQVGMEPVAPKTSHSRTRSTPVGALTDAQLGVEVSNGLSSL